MSSIFTPKAGNMVVDKFMQIDQQMPQILDLVKQSAQIAISSDPGSGKSTRIPPALVKAGYRVLVLEPRRISAMSLATYISETGHTPVGREIGYQVRGDSKRSAATKALFVTEALLPKYLDNDPALSDWDVVILDEFHERHIHTDIAWALLNQIQKELRPELKIILLSATLNLEEVKKRWPDVESLHIKNPPHPLELRYIEVPKALTDPRAVRQALVQLIVNQPFAGDVLVFLPGFGDIERCQQDLLANKKLSSSTLIMPLYGSQSLSEQRRVLQKSSQQKIILATNVAESSITIDGVRVVIDAGLERVAWANTKSGLTELKTQRISKSSATQRAGRAARQGPGVCYRLWNESEQSALDEFALAEIHRSDLSEVLYAILASGWDPLGDDFVWFEKPLAQRLQDSWQRLLSLGLVDEARHLRAERKALAAYPIGLRGAIYLESLLTRHHKPQASDFAIAAWISSPDGRSPHDTNYVRDAEAAARHHGHGVPSFPREIDLHPLREWQEAALIDAIPDRFFERRAPESAAVKLQSGRGATLQQPHQHSGERYGFALMLREADPDAVAQLWVPATKATYLKLQPRSEAKAAKPHTNFWDADLPRVQNLLRRAEIFKKVCLASFDLRETLEQAAQSLRDAQPKAEWSSLESDILAWTQGMNDQKVWKRFEAACPTHWTLPRSGRHAELRYIDTTRIELHARLQEFLGQTDHPMIAEAQIPLTLVLLSPAQRPIQITQRLGEFWGGSYLEIKKEMKARYPKHDW